MDSLAKSQFRLIYISLPILSKIMAYLIKSSLILEYFPCEYLNIFYLFIIVALGSSMQLVFSPPSFINIYSFAIFLKILIPPPVQGNSYLPCSSDSKLNYYRLKNYTLCVLHFKIYIYSIKRK